MLLILFFKYNVTFQKELLLLLIRKYYTELIFILFSLLLLFFFFTYIHINKYSVYFLSY